ncbi:MAG: calcium-binding protein [Methyloceanibacter sp.]|uniref:calcium-binding protein n=1 Tax=Methyloceanibacter sp. TaxID=1965321 RepID=UPI003D6C7654
MAKGNYTAFLNALGERESNGNYAAVNQFGYLGKYQFGEFALRDIGYYTYDGTSANDFKTAYWTGKNGIDSKAEFLGSPSAQESAIREYMTLQWQYVKTAWAYEGQTLDGIKITESGMLAGAHLVGAGNLNKYLLSGGDAVSSDGNSVKVSSYVKQFAGYDTPFSANHSVAETIKGGSGNDKLSGRGGDDKLHGKGANDILDGGAGNDKLSGSSGDDKLKGGGGHDSLTGGSGKDHLYGGAGHDTFSFNNIKHSRPGSDRDVIHDFRRAEGDLIGLRKIDADIHTPGDQAFKFIGTKKFHKIEGELRFKDDVLQGDVNGDGKADFEIRIEVSKLVADDFLL